MMDDDPAARSTGPSAQGGPTSPALILFCLKVGLLSFGGGLSGWLYREFVLRRVWMTDEEFASCLAYAQMMPGPTITNLVICCTSQFIGTAGVVGCVLALFAGPFVAVISLYRVYHQFSAYPAFQAITDGVVFAAIGLMMVLAVRGVRRAWRGNRPGLAVIAATAVMVGVLHWPMIPVALSMAALSVVLAWRSA